MKLNQQLKFGSLFAGIGGFDLGFERAGMECAWQVEIDEHCNDVLRQHWPEVERYGDVKEIDGQDLEPVDLIAGGFPCQDVSVAGRRAGLAGKRSGLWWEFHRILEEHHPAWAVIENVPGLLSSNRGLDFATVVLGLAQLGYGIAWRVLDAQNFGVPQRRRRIFIVGHLGNHRAVEVLFESESLQGDPAPGQEARKTIASAITKQLGSGGPDDNRAQSRHLVAGPLGGGNDGRGRRTEDDPNLVLAPPLTARQGKGAFTDPVNDGIIAAPLRSRQHPNSNIPGRGGEDDENLIIGFTPGNSADSYGIGDQENVSPPVRGGGAGAKPTFAISENQRAEVRLTKTTFSLSAGGGKPGQGYPSVMIQAGVRRLMPIECERLQGFPDGWTEGHADSHRYRMLGNAVCVPVAEWLGKRIMAFR